MEKGTECQGFIDFRINNVFYGKRLDCAEYINVQHCTGRGLCIVNVFGSVSAENVVSNNLLILQSCCLLWKVSQIVSREHSRSIKNKSSFLSKVRETVNYKLNESQTRHVHR